MNLAFIGKLDIGITMKSLIVISCPWQLFLATPKTINLRNISSK